MSKSIPKIKAPKGFSFKVKKMSANYTRVTLHLAKGKQIGYVNLSRVRPGFYATHSGLDVKYHNKGLGVLLYARAIQYALEKGWRVSSSGGSSESAQRVWRGKTIRKYFSIKLKKGYQPYDDKWYAYAK
jgi:GNAT superfamily N-acetyltransferase